MAGLPRSFSAQFARLGERLGRVRSGFDTRISDPLIARLAPKADAKTKTTLRTAILAFALLLAGGTVGGLGYILVAPDHRITILVGGISGDTDGSWHTRVRSAIGRGLGNAVILRDVRDTLPREDTIVDKNSEYHRDARAQAIIQREDAASLVWGEVSPSGTSVQLFFLAWDGTTRTSTAHRYLRKGALKITAARDDAIDAAIALTAFRQARGKRGQIAKVGDRLGAIRATLDARAQAKEGMTAARGEILRGAALALLMHSEGLHGRPLYKRAIDIYDSALVGISPVTSPFDWAAAKADDADLLSSVGLEEGPDFTRQALAARAQVLAFYSKKGQPLDWARADIDYGLAQSQLADALGDSGMQQAAIDTMKQALDVFTESETPLDWADTEYGMGVALRELSYASNDAGPLAPALDALHLALKERTRARAPYDWANTQSEIGTVERMAAGYGNDPKAFDAAVAADREVLKVFTRRDDPGGWANAETELGNVLGDRAKMIGAAKDFDDAIAAYKGAQEVYIEESSPSGQAVMLYDLGITYRDYGKLKKDAALFKQAIDVLNQSIALYTKYNFSGGARNAKSVLDSVNSELAALH